VDLDHGKVTGLVSDALLYSHKEARMSWLSTLRRLVFRSCIIAGVLVTAGPWRAEAADTPNPTSVTIPGSFQQELGCPGDWQPDCAATQLSFDLEDGVWQGAFDLPAGGWEYKAALNGAWDENYGQNAARGGANLVLNLVAATRTRFYYDHETHWVADDRSQVIATAPGSYQTFLGCGGNWDPGCLRAWLQDPDGDGLYSFTTRAIPAGTYEVKVAIGESWAENYGQGGARDGANIAFVVPADCTEMLFRYDAASHVLTVGPAPAPAQPGSVTIAGSFQQELGCADDWQPWCGLTHLGFDAEDGVWQGTFNLPAGSWEYKAALNDAWDENYGQNATRGGANIALGLATAGDVKFYYDHATHWVADGRGPVIATAPGSYQSLLGCNGNWDPACLRTWLQDPDGDGSYSFSTRALPAGNYEVKVAVGESWAENYGQGGVRDGANIAFEVPVSCTEMVFTYDAVSHRLEVGVRGAARGNLKKARAYWLARDVVAWNPPPGASVRLHHAAAADLRLGANGVEGGASVALLEDPAGLPAALRARFPHLASLRAFRVPAAFLTEVPSALREQVAVSARDTQDRPLDATALQLPGALDDVYAYDGPLGVTWSGGTPTLRVWAPTAQSVRLHLFPDSNPASSASVVAMSRDDASGVWSVSGAPSWKNQFYLYEVRVFVRATGSFETNLVTDPYSLSLALNSQRSQIVDLADPALAPAGWACLTKPALEAPEDIVLYELHVRDFSANDASVPAALRGTFSAFALPDSNGVRHLRALSESGLSHVHLLPAFDFATVDEDRSTWQDPGDLSGFAPNSSAQQAAVNTVRGRDGFNWGYDPWHYTVPDGSYATNPDGSARIREFRGMVKALADLGLRVVMDVVYNHTTASGQNARSVLDRVVPGYYHRLNADGDVERSTCCDNTASEHRMMEKLLIDSVLTWARDYKVDGFRFDLMGHHMKSNMLRLRAALDALEYGRDGVDGPQVYLYGEGWNFGEVANNARGENAVQLNMAGTGIGTFSDRLRDAARGGGPFSGLSEQGFLTGLHDDPNSSTSGTPGEQLERLLTYADRIRVGLAGNLASVQLEDRLGQVVTGAQVDYFGLPTGYAADPQEVIHYVEAHDNETLFDAIQAKAAAGTPLAERIRMQQQGLALVGLAQGVPFFHAGMELLRSKSLDRNSYDSGDWFNRLDFTYQSNNWGVGLPPAGDNQANWPLATPLLADPALRPTAADITATREYFREVLLLRRSLPLLRLPTAQEIRDRVAFHNTGPSQVPGVVAMSVSDSAGTRDRRVTGVTVVFNVNREPRAFTTPGLAGSALKLHPIQRLSVDARTRTSTFDSDTGTFSIPGRTSAVFWAPRPLVAQVDLLVADIDALLAAGSLNAAQGTSLKAKLAAARRQFERDRPRLAVPHLQAFLRQVQTLVGRGTLSSEAGYELLRWAQSLIEQAQLA
jgi:pullulanase-type alpha-1,6-glucosidase